LRLISVRAGSGSTLGVQAGERWLPAHALAPTGPRTIAELIAGGPAAVDVLRAAADEARILEEGRPIADAELLAPVARPGKVVAIGRNYRDHTAEEGVDAPAAPLIFSKWPSSIVGPGAEIRWDPALTRQVDYEAELAVVIGRTARRVTEADALGHVLGYTCLNDVSARDLQFADKQFVRAKSLDTFCPMGPAVVTADEVADPGALAVRSYLNGVLMQDGNTADLIFGVPALVAFCSRAFTLEPGDVIATGTPAGIGALADGDTVEISIEGIGTPANPVRAAGI
jgi:5-carboxymethyl-2-hydroxymuconate isomerase